MLVYADTWLLAFDKPEGLLSVPGRGADKQDCLAARVQEKFPGALIVHRLDRDTSGVIVLARNAETHRELGRQFEAREVEKGYVAVVAGIVVADEGVIDVPLRKDFDRPPRHMVDRELGRPAITRYRVLLREPDRTRLALSPLTGRSHQLRVHLAHLGHPVLGDPLYADAAVLSATPRLMLHAAELSFDHPATGERLKIEAPCPF